MPNIESLLHDLSQANPGYELRYDSCANRVVATSLDHERYGATYYYNVAEQYPMWRQATATSNDYSVSDASYSDCSYTYSAPEVRYATCAECGRTYTVNDIHEFETEEVHLCARCKSAPRVKCEICGEMHKAYWSCGSDNKYSVCHSCYSHFTNEHPINRFNYKPTPVFYGNPSDKAFFGVEVEVDYGINAWMSAAKVTHDFNEVYVKHDGSLEEEGIEVVTHPASLLYHKTEFPWDKILDTLRYYGYKADTTETCGLHIHISRNFFGDSTVEQDCNIAKLILVVQRFWDSHLVPFSRRRLSRLQRWAKKPEFKFNTNASIGSIVDRQKRELCRDHYNGINILPPHTVEFRMFRGSMDKNIIFASMELVYALSNFAKKIELRDIDSCTWEQIFDGMDRNEYKCLFDYMETKCLFDSSKMETIFDENYVMYEFMPEENIMSRDGFSADDVVVIRSWESMAAEFGFSDDIFLGQRIQTPRAHFIEEMRPLCGRLARIEDTYDDDPTVEITLLESDSHTDRVGGWTITRDMLRLPTFDEYNRYHQLTSRNHDDDLDYDWLTF